MNANAFRQLYDYHFSENHKLLDGYAVQLSWEQIIQPIAYSHGSIRNQLVHMMHADEAWFSDLRGDAFPEQKQPEDFNDLQSIRTEWETVERKMREYLAGLQDERLMDKPLSGEDKDLFLWQVLIHVANHGTDHRAQTLRILHDMGVETSYQDFIFYVFETLSGSG